MCWSKRKIRALLRQKKLSLSRGRTSNWRSLFFRQQTVRKSLPKKRLESFAMYLMRLPRRQIRHVIERCYLNWTKTCQVFGIRQRNLRERTKWRVKTVFKDLDTVFEGSLLAESGIESDSILASSRSIEWENLTSSSLIINFDCCLVFEEASSSGNSTLGLVEKAVEKEQRNVVKCKQEKSIVEEEKSIVEEEKSIVEEEKSIVEEEKSIVEEEKSIVEEEKSIVEEEKSVVEEEKSIVEEESRHVEQEKGVVRKDQISQGGTIIKAEKLAAKEEEENAAKEDENAAKEDEKKIARKDKMKVSQEKEKNVKSEAENPEKVKDNTNGEKRVVKKEGKEVAKNDEKNPKKRKKIAVDEEKKVSEIEAKKATTEEQKNIEEVKKTTNEGNFDNDISVDEKLPDCTNSPSETQDIPISPLILKFMRKFTDRVENTTATEKCPCNGGRFENLNQSRGSSIDKESNNDSSKKKLEKIVGNSEGGTPLENVSVGELSSLFSSTPSCSPTNGFKKIVKCGKDEPNSYSDLTDLSPISRDSLRGLSDLSSVEIELPTSAVFPQRIIHSLATVFSSKPEEIVLSSDDDMAVTIGSEKSTDVRSSAIKDDCRAFSAPLIAVPSFKNDKVPKGAKSAGDARKEHPTKTVFEPVRATNEESKNVRNEEITGTNNWGLCPNSGAESSIVKEASHCNNLKILSPKLKMVPVKTRGLLDIPRTNKIKNIIANWNPNVNGFTTSTPVEEIPANIAFMAEDNRIFSSIGIQTDAVEAQSVPTAKGSSHPIAVDVGSNSLSDAKRKQKNRQRKKICHCKKVALNVRHLYRKVIGLKKLVLHRTRTYRADRSVFASLLEEHTKVTKSCKRVLKDLTRVVEGNNNVIRALEIQHSLSAQPAKESEAPESSVDLTSKPDAETITSESLEVDEASRKAEAASLSSVTKRLFDEVKDVPSSKDFKRKTKKCLSLSQSSRTGKSSTDSAMGWDIIRLKATEFGGKGCSAQVFNSSSESHETKSSSQELSNQSTEILSVVCSSESSVASNVGSDHQEEEPKTEEQTVEELRKCLKELADDDDDERFEALPKKRKHIRFQIDEEDELAAGASAASEPLSQMEGIPSSSKLRRSLRLKKEAHQLQNGDHKNRERVNSTKEKVSLSSDEDNTWKQYIKELGGRFAKGYLLSDSHTSESGESEDKSFTELPTSSKIRFYYEDILSHLFLDEHLSFRSRKIDPNFKGYSYDEIALLRILSDLKSNGDVGAAEEAILTARILGRSTGDVIRKQLRQYLNAISPSAPFYFHVNLELATGEETLRIFAKQAWCRGDRIDALEGVKGTVKTISESLLQFRDETTKEEENKITVLLGPVSHMMHSCYPNVKIVSVDRNTVETVALFDILPGDELSIAEGSCVDCTVPKRNTKRKLYQKPAGETVSSTAKRTSRQDSIFVPKRRHTVFEF